MSSTVCTRVPVDLEGLERIIRRGVREGLADGRRQARFVDLDGVARRFQVSRSTVVNWVRHADCPHLMKGKILRFDLVAVDAWFRGGAAHRRRRPRK